MNILIFESKNFGIDDVCAALTKMGHTHTCISTELIHERKSAEFDALFEQEFGRAHFDCVFTFNYSPVLSNACNKHHIPYISYIYDSPLVALYSYTIINPCNYCFIFDKTLYNEFKQENISTVYYMPLAVNTDRLTQMITHPHLPQEKYTAEISFVGSMYNEKHNLFDRLKGLPEHTQGYLDAIMDAQLQVYGYYFIPELLSKDILADLQKSVPVEPNKDGVETVEYLYAYYFIARKLAEKERTQILSKLSNEFSVKLFTPNPTPNLPKIQNMGPVDYYNEMPYIFHNSAINLNISLRSIRSGIPLRGMDIMGAHGFLMSNYQADFYDFFVPGEDLVLYESQDDLLKKCQYYLTHETERKQIADNGYGKMKEFHTYEKHLAEMFEIVFG